jgi:hypothetical protein
MVVSRIWGGWVLNKGHAEVGLHGDYSVCWLVHTILFCSSGLKVQGSQFRVWRKHPAASWCSLQVVHLFRVLVSGCGTMMGMYCIIWGTASSGVPKVCLLLFREVFDGCLLFLNKVDCIMS